jgi:hypothetical protein
MGKLCEKPLIWYSLLHRFLYRGLWIGRERLDAVDVVGVGDPLDRLLRPKRYRWSPSNDAGACRSQLHVDLLATIILEREFRRYLLSRNSNGPRSKTEGWMSNASIE